MEAEQDSTVVWAFDRLVGCPGVPTDALMQTLLPALFPLGLDELSETTRARLLLRLLAEDLQTGQLDLEVLKTLRRLAEVEGVGGWTAGGLPPRPPPDLLLRVRIVLSPFQQACGFVGARPALCATTGTGGWGPACLLGALLPSFRTLLP